MSLQEKITRLLKEKLSARHVEVLDESQHHAGHPEALKSGGGHFSVVVIADCFEGKSRLERHRLIYLALKEVKEGIHALAIKALSPKEVN